MINAPGDSTCPKQEHEVWRVALGLTKPEGDMRFSTTCDGGGRDTIFFGLLVDSEREARRPSAVRDARSVQFSRKSSSESRVDLPYHERTASLQ